MTTESEPMEKPALRLSTASRSNRWVPVTEIAAVPQPVTRPFFTVGFTPSAVEATAAEEPSPPVRVWPIRSSVTFGALMTMPSPSTLVRLPVT